MPQLEHIEAIEKRLWSAADTLRANSNLASNQYFLPVMGLVFLRHAYSRYLAVRDEVTASLPKRGGVARPVTKADFSDKGALFLQPKARYDYLASLPDGANRAQAIVEAMESIEEDYESLRGVLPKNDYRSISDDVLGKLLAKLDPEELKHMSGDVFGRIYEYFLTQFAGQGAHDGGEFFTPISLVSFIANVLEPERGVVLDPACGSGGMFVQSARVVERRSGRPSDTLTFYGMEKNDVTIRLAKMNLAVHGLEGDIRQAITYYADPHELVGKCDFVMANPPFNVDDIDAARVKSDPRLPFGLPGENKEGRVPNGNYVWISYFYSYLNETGRAGFVMAAGAEAAGRDEALVRRKLVETGAVDVMVSIRSNFFYTRTVPCVLWFIDRGKAGQGVARPSPGQPSPPAPLPRGEGSNVVGEGASLTSPEGDAVMAAQYPPLPLGEGPGATQRPPLPLGEGSGVRACRVRANTPSPAGRGLGVRAVDHYRGGYDFAGLLKKVRELRAHQTPAETLFWELVRDRRFMGLKFRRQHQFGDYVLDFYCDSCKLAVELDGEIHENTKQHDHKRDAYLTSSGIHVLRFKNSELFDTPQEVLDKLAIAIGQSSPNWQPSPPTPLPEVEGLGDRQPSPPTPLPEVEGRGDVESKLLSPLGYGITNINPPPSPSGRRAGTTLPSSSGRGTNNADNLPSPSGRGANNADNLPSPSGRGVGGEGDVGVGEGDVASLDRRRHVLMIDARNVFRKVTRKICDFSPEQERNLVAIVWLYRGETERFRALLADYRAQSAAVDLAPVVAFWDALGAAREDSVSAVETAAKAKIAALDAAAAKADDAKARREAAKAAKAVEAAASAAVEALKLKAYYLDATRWLEERFPDGVYRDVEGLVRAVTIDEIAANDWSLTPGRYVGVAETDDGDEDFAEKFAALHEELRRLDVEAAQLAKKIDANFGELMG